MEMEYNKASTMMLNEQMKGIGRQLEQKVDLVEVQSQLTEVARGVTEQHLRVKKECLDKMKELERKVAEELRQRVLMTQLTKHL